MQTDTSIVPSTAMVAPIATRKVVIINGDAEAFDNLNVLDEGHYDVVFVESNEHAYSQVKRVQPNLVILCTRMDDPEGFRVLSMLKLDDETRRIPVLTYTTEYRNEPEPEETPELTDGDEIFAAAKPAFQMN